jgi:hypothetical protein
MGINRRNRMVCGEHDESIALAVEEWIATDKKRTYPLCGADQPVEPCHHQHVTRFEPPEHLGKLGTIYLRAGNFSPYTLALGWMCAAAPCTMTGVSTGSR